MAKRRSLKPVRKSLGGVASEVVLGPNEKRVGFVVNGSTGTAFTVGLGWTIDSAGEGVHCQNANGPFLFPIEVYGDAVKGTINMRGSASMFVTVVEITED